MRLVAPLLLLSLSAALFAGCTDAGRAGDTVPFPQPGDWAEYTSEGTVLSFFPLCPACGMMLLPEDGPPSVVNTSAGARIRVTAEEPSVRLDAYQHRHDAIALNWTWIRSDGVFPFFTQYVSLSTHQALLNVHTVDTSQYAVIWNFGVPSPLGSSLFWGEALYEGKRFLKEVALPPAVKDASTLNEVLKLELEVTRRLPESRDHVFEVTVNNPEILRNRLGHGQWKDLSFLVSTSSPFVASRTGTWENEGTYHQTTTRIAQQIHSGPPQVIFGPRQPWATSPQAVTPRPWDGKRVPGEGTDFATFTITDAMRALEGDLRYIANVAVHGEHQVLLASYWTDPAQQKWILILTNLAGTHSMSAFVTRGGSGELSTHLEETTPPWPARDASQDPIISIDDCWTLWRMYVGDAPVNSPHAVYEMTGKDAYCGAADAAGPFAFSFWISATGAVLGEAVVSYWPRA